MIPVKHRSSTISEIVFREDYEEADILEVGLNSHTNTFRIPVGTSLHGTHVDIPQIAIEAGSKPLPESKGKIFLGSMEAVFSFGDGGNPNNIQAVLSCVPEVNENINTLVRKAGIAHHDYFLLDDNDALIQGGNHGRHTSPLHRYGSPLHPRGDESPRAPHHQGGTIFERFQSGDQLQTALAFIHQHRLAARNVLVHCDGGVLRSPATVISYLMTYVHKSMKEAKMIVTQCRPTVHVRRLEESLSVLERSLQGSSASCRTTTSACTSLNVPSGASNFSSFEYSTGGSVARSGASAVSSFECSAGRAAGATTSAEPDPHVFASPQLLSIDEGEHSDDEHERPTQFGLPKFPAPRALDFSTRGSDRNPLQQSTTLHQHDNSTVSGTMNGQSEGQVGSTMGSTSGSTSAMSRKPGLSVRID